jgi:dihydropteroate synthase
VGPLEATHYGRRVILDLGPRRYDIATRALVAGILNRTPDSFFDDGAYFEFDAYLRKADELVAAGADILDVGGVKAAVIVDGVGPDVGPEEELDRVVPAVEALAARFDVPISVDTWRASVAEACFNAGASVGNDITGFADPDYLRVCAGAGASVVATHMAPAEVSGPGHDDGNRETTSTEPSSVESVARALADLASTAEAAGIGPTRIMVDPGLDLRKPPAFSLELLRSTDRIAAIGYPVFLALSNKDVLGWLHGTPVTDRQDATTAAHALGIALGGRVLRAHDVRAARRVCDVMAAILEAA